VSAWDKIFGISLVVATIAAFVSSACDAFLRHPNGWGIALVVCQLATMCWAVGSILRDRL
jgi:hypothetical protein